MCTPGSLGSVAGPEDLSFSRFPGNASAEARETHFECHTSLASVLTLVEHWSSLWSL